MVRMLLLALLMTVLPVRPSTGHAPVVFATWSFGISLATGQHSELYSLFLVKEFEQRVIATEPITREQFILQAQGAVPSKANPIGDNLFIRHGVVSCVHPSDATIALRDCAVFDDLWKLRFWEYPFHVKQGVHPGRGWAEQKESPSERQMLLLSDFGIRHLSGLAYGDHAFRLLHAMCDSAWVDNYRKGY